MPSSSLSPSMQRCIDECLHCSRICRETALLHCLTMGGQHTEPEHFRLMLNCADMCRTCADIMLSGSDLHSHSCAACAAFCDACAESCERIGDMDECVQSCRSCATSCHQMGALRGQIGAPVVPVESSHSDVMHS